MGEIIGFKLSGGSDGERPECVERNSSVPQLTGAGIALAFSLGLAMLAGCVIASEANATASLDLRRDAFHRGLVRRLNRQLHPLVPRRLFEERLRELRRK